MLIHTPIHLEDREEKRALGLVIVRGENVVSITIEGPPPLEDNRLKATEAAQSGPGMGRAAARGVPLPPSGAPVPGLAAPSRGVGVGGAAQMQPQTQHRAPVPPPPGVMPGGVPPPPMPPMMGGRGMPPMPPSCVVHS